jgi:hypothetical protein
MITVAESLASMLAQQAARPATRPAKGNFYASRAWQSLRYKALERANVAGRAPRRATSYMLTT